jgi:aspartyl-tRNA(Asn)/glutamyl-tRNA(Gln) amidotransferase subunit A
MIVAQRYCQRMTILEISRQLRNRELSPVELTQRCLQRIEQLNPTLNAFITVTPDTALAEARRAEQEIWSGQWRGPLHGIPIALKDLIDTAGVPTTAASALFQNRIPNQDAEVVRRLKTAGAVFLGKNNLHEFAYGGSSMVSHYSPTRNPWNPEHITGGSSGGSAAAVAAELCYAAIGTDTAGSIREPAAYCGVVGIKPTYGLVSTEGVIPLSWSLDHVGPLTRNVADAAVVLQAIAQAETADYLTALAQNPAELLIAVPRPFFFEGLDPEISSATESALTFLRSIVKAVVEISIDINTDRTLQLAESYKYHCQWIADSPHLYQTETLRRIRAGTNVTAEQFGRAKAGLTKEREEIKRVFEHVDALITPTMPVSAPLIAELEQHPDQLRPAELLMLRNTRPFNVWGLPAISVPCGFTSGGMPIGLQIAGAPGREDIVLALAYVYEQATDWHMRNPQILAKCSIQRNS